MTRAELINQIKTKKTFLCVGLDPDIDKIPQFLLEEDDPIFEFNKAIIDATHDLCVSYKPNTAFYEAYGIKGWQSLQPTKFPLMHIPLHEHCGYSPSYGRCRKPKAGRQKELQK